MPTFIVSAALECEGEGELEEDELAGELSVFEPEVVVGGAPEAPPAAAEEAEESVDAATFAEEAEVTLPGEVTFAGGVTSPGEVELEVEFCPMAVAWNLENVFSAVGFTAKTMPAWQWSMGLPRDTRLERDV